MIVNLTSRARRELLRLQAHWLEHGDSKLVLIEDLEAAQETLSHQPNVGPVYPSNRKDTVRRLLLPRAHCYLYYVVRPQADRIDVLAVWSTHRGRTPKV